jgi:hypothetical protein
MVEILFCEFYFEKSAGNLQSITQAPSCVSGRNAYRVIKINAMMIIGKSRMVFIAILFGLFIANVVPAKFRV